MLTEWTQSKAEEEYIRIIYVGKMVSQDKDHESGDTTTTTLKDTMADIWKVSSVFNKANFIGGHLAWTEDSYVGQLLEGPKKVVLSLMEKIKKDPRVDIDKVFSRDVFTTNTGWEMSMCYSFEKTRLEVDIIDNPDISLELVFHEINNTQKIKEERLLTLPQFFQYSIELFTMKYVSLVDQQSYTVKTADAVAGVGLRSTGEG